ncbi:CPBP family intramembrane metalloprotease [Natronosporangium hydrolyticum]|uniref:CPBP family intramembrane metalloprotease n=1 Tax=Natronosporangium hydrolyticum TaxID=2811111 RepID=A0A895YF55_9ACTN|nr:type II CAAX endopeptidase family protein [Natronosporangium hydrolyticum]QSB12830.1 CPBP family intramembrane metalloprotease [Natronosporangium hydrolyticum]
MRLLKQLGAVAVVAFAGSLAVQAVAPNAVLTLVLGLATAVLALLVYAGMVRWTERRRPTEVALRPAAGATFRGLLIGVGMFAAVIATIAYLGGYRVEGWGSATGVLAIFGFMAAAAVTEEVIFRGILFRIVEEWIGTWNSLVLTGLIFGLVHLPNSNANLWGALAIAIQAGAMLAAAYAATRSLWLVIGLHFGWNFAAAGIFGVTVSGQEGAEGLLRSVTSGPMLLSGGEFGPEASLYAVLAGALLTVVFMWLAHRRGNLVPRRRRGNPTGSAEAASEAPATGSDARLAR